MLLMTWLNKGEAKMRLEFVVVIGIVLLMHSIYWAGAIASRKEQGDRWSDLKLMAFSFPLYTVASSIPTFIVVGLLYWWLYAF